MNIKSIRFCGHILGCLLEDGRSFAMSLESTQDKDKEVFEICGYCGKECGPKLPTKMGGNPKVYHWDCAFDKCRESREKLHKGNKDVQKAFH
jgi:hypothetical protein